jgi:hypothetical protein
MAALEFRASFAHHDRGENGLGDAIVGLNKRGGRMGSIASPSSSRYEVRTSRVARLEQIVAESRNEKMLWKMLMDAW